MILNFKHLFFSYVMSFMTGLVITTGNYRLLYISSVDYGNATVDSYEFLIINFIGYDKAISRLL